MVMVSPIFAVDALIEDATGVKPIGSLQFKAFLGQSAGHDAKSSPGSHLPLLLQLLPPVHCSKSNVHASSPDEWHVNVPETLPRDWHVAPFNLSGCPGSQSSPWSMTPLPHDPLPPPGIIHCHDGLGPPTPKIKSITVPSGRSIVSSLKPPEGLQQCLFTFAPRMLACSTT